MKKCSICTIEINEGNSFEIKEAEVCMDCFNAEYFLCQSCGKGAPLPGFGLMLEGAPSPEPEDALCEGCYLKESQSA